MAELQKAFNLADIDTAIKVAQELVNTKKAYLLVTQTKQEKKLEDLAIETLIQGIAQEFDEQEKQAKINSRDQKNENYDKFDIAIDFNSQFEASKFEEILHNKLNIMDSEISTRAGKVKLKIYDITTKDQINIEKYITLDNVKKATVNTTDKIVTKTTDAVEFLANDILAPIGQIGFKGLSALTKSAIKTLSKVGATATSSVISGSKQLKNELCSDPDIIRATADVIATKDNIMSACSGKKLSNSRISRI
jgi:hypothetical protein